jgi:hypothetical protein
MQILHVVADGEGGVKKKRKKKAHLAGCKRLLESFLVLQRRPECGWWWQQWLRCDGENGQSGGWEGEKKN